MIDIFLLELFPLNCAITFNNQIMINGYTVSTKTCTTKILNSIFLIEKLVGFIYAVSFVTVYQRLVITPHPHKCITFNIVLHSHPTQSYKTNP